MPAFMNRIVGRISGKLVHGMSEVARILHLVVRGSADPCDTHGLYGTVVEVGINAQENKH